MAMNKKIIIIFLTIIVLTGTAIISHEPVLQKMGNYLVLQGPLEPAEAIIVLSGSSTGNRIRAGAMLFQKGLGKIIIISGNEIYPEYYTHTIMKIHAIQLGVPEDKFIVSPIEGEINTWGEGIHNLKKLKENNFKSFILVTSAFHSYRAHKIYDQIISELGYNFKWSVYPAEDPRIPIEDWWKKRVARKGVFMEFIKLLYFFIEH